MKNKLIRIYFWVGVNVIGIPDLCIHEKKIIEPSSRFFAKKPILSINQFNELV